MISNPRGILKSVCCEPFKICALLPLFQLTAHINCQPFNHVCKSSNDQSICTRDNRYTKC